MSDPVSKVLESILTEINEMSEEDFLNWANNFEDEAFFGLKMEHIKFSGRDESLVLPATYSAGLQTFNFQLKSTEFCRSNLSAA